MFRFSNLKICWGKAAIILHALSFCFSSHLAKGSWFWILKFWYQKIIHWINLNLQGAFDLQSSSFTPSPDLAESFCNCSMNSCARGLEIVSGHRGAAIPVAQDQTQESALNQPDSERSWSRTTWKVVIYGVSSLLSVLHKPQQMIIPVKTSINGVNQGLTGCLLQTLPVFLYCLNPE